MRGLSYLPSGAACYSVGDHGSATVITGTVLAAYSTGLVTNLHSVHFPIDSNEGWLCGGAIIRHFTGGAWPGDQTYQTNGYHAIAFHDLLNGWAVGDNGVIANTIDGGKVGLSPLAGWHLQTNPDSNFPQRTLNGLYALNGNEAWAVGDGGVILHTLNGGQTWNVEAAGTTTSLLTAVHAEDSSTAYVVGTNGTVLKYTHAAIGLDEHSFLPIVVRSAP